MAPKGPRALACAALAVALGLASAGNVVATSISWTTPVNLRVHEHTELVDADFDGSAIAVAWSEAWAEQSKVKVRTSNNRGDSFSPSTRFDDAWTAAVDVCDGEVHVATARRTDSNKWAIVHAAGDAAGGGFVLTTVAQGKNVDPYSDVAIACAEERVFIGWYQYEGASRRLYVASALRADGAFGAPMDLGDVEHFALAASGAMAYALYGLSNGDLRIKRWSIGGGADHRVTSLGVQVLVPQARHKPVGSPVIAAEGDTVAIGWHRCWGVYARVSADRGSSWGPVRTISELGCQAVDTGKWPTAVAVRGRNLVLSYDVAGIGGSYSSVVRSSNGFGSFQAASLGSHQFHVVGFVVVGGQARIADAYDQNSSRIRFRHQI